MKSIPFPIDIVITWVNGGDPKWIEKKSKYSSDRGMNGENRFRDFEMFQYTFRSIEKFAPWVNKIFLVTDNQVPEWMDKNNSKLRIVDHKDFIPEKYLPTFNSNAIEMNIFRIKELSEHFILMNDDMIFIKNVKPTDFFCKDGRSLDSAILSPLSPIEDFNHINVNNMITINNSFTKHEVIKNNFRKFYNLKYGKALFRTIMMAPFPHFSNFWETHIAYSYSKSDFVDFWKNHFDLAQRTSKNKFRSNNDISHWLIRYEKMCQGNFVPRRVSFGKTQFIVETSSIKKAIRGNTKVICLNDPDKIKLKEITLSVTKVKKMLNEILGNKSTFEI